MRHRVHEMPFGAHVTADGVRFRLWAPAAAEVRVHLEGHAAPLALQAGAGGWFETLVPGIAPGARYAFTIDANDLRIPDPASRRQSSGVHGPSVVVDPRSFAWSDAAWRGRPWEEIVLYELHLGTFTPEGTFLSAIERLDYLADLGVTAIELMPIAESPGARNWGYDGTLWYAPEGAYGSPDDLKALVAAAHERGLCVFLDVVYNHFGPEGNYLHVYAREFFTRKYATPWGAAIDYEGQPVVRAFAVHNALYWLEEFHFDGLRLDAVQAIHGDPRPTILQELAQAVHARFGDRHVHLVVENEDNEAHLLDDREARDPRRYDAQWNDDLHHALHVVLTGECTGYYADYGDDPLGHLARTLTEGFSYQGQLSPHRGGEARGEPSTALPPTAFVAFLQNHDHVGNRAFGDRIGALAPAKAVRAAAALYVLAPSIPLLFMGEEWNASTPFTFFCDFGSDLRASVRDGRRREFGAFSTLTRNGGDTIPDPFAARTFSDCVLRWDERQRDEHAAMLAFYRELLHVRARDIVPLLAGIRPGAGSFERDPGGALRVMWRLGDGSGLELTANLQAEPAPQATAPSAAARILVATHEHDTGTLPPWYVRWSLLQAVPA